MARKGQAVAEPVEMLAGQNAEQVSVEDGPVVKVAEGLHSACSRVPPAQYLTPVVLAAVATAAALGNSAVPAGLPLCPAR